MCRALASRHFEGSPSQRFIGPLPRPNAGRGESMTKTTSLSGLSHEKVSAGFKKLQHAGVTPERWLAMLDADVAAMRRLAAAWPGAPPTASKGGGLIYDAAAVSRILGIPAECPDPVPPAAAGEVVIYSGGWNLRTLRTSAAG